MQLNENSVKQQHEDEQQKQKVAEKRGNLYEEPGLLRLYTTFGFT